MQASHNRNVFVGARDAKEKRVATAPSTTKAIYSNKDTRKKMRR